LQTTSFISFHIVPYHLVLLLADVRRRPHHTMPCTTPSQLHHPCSSSTSTSLIIPSGTILPRHSKVLTNGVVLSDDDDSSTSSTVLVSEVAVSTPCGGLQSSNNNNNNADGFVSFLSNSDEKQNQQQKKKSVSFDETRNISYRNMQNMSSEECKRLWCSVQDALRFREATSGLAKQVARFEELDTSEHSYRRVMERTYEACCCCCQEESIGTNEDEPSDDDESTAVSSSVLTTAGEQALEKWMDRATTRLGLEKRAIRLIAQDRSARRKCIIRTVLRIQREARSKAAASSSSSSSKTTTTTTTTTPDERQAKLICSSCQAISRPSRLFAQVVAHALAAVVVRGEST
jgi:hypothetical protein